MLDKGRLWPIDDDDGYHSQPVHSMPGTLFNPTLGNTAICVPGHIFDGIDGVCDGDHSYGHVQCS